MFRVEVQMSIQDYYDNRNMNATNPYQGKAKRVLCVCSAGLLRSPTLAWVLSNAPYNFNTRAAGSEASYALVAVDQVLINWADLVISVNPDNTIRLARFDLSQAQVLTLNIPDKYKFRDPELVEIIKEQLAEADVN